MTSSRGDVRRPSGGTQPPATAELGDGEVLHLSVLAHEVSRRFQQEHPDEEERYGRAAFEWCVHDNQWLLGWAALEARTRQGHFFENVRWLGRVLTARDYPLERLVRDLELAAEVVGVGTDARRELARTLAEGAAMLREREPDRAR
jgi:hypothetical protein